MEGNFSTIALNVEVFWADDELASVKKSKKKNGNNNKEKIINIQADNRKNDVLFHFSSPQSNLELNFTSGQP